MKMVLVLFSCMLAGCAATIPPKVTQINTFMPGQVQVKKTGEPMLERGTITALPGFLAKLNYYPPEMEGVVFPLIRKGDVWYCPKRLDDGDLVCLNDGYYQESLVPTGDQVLHEKPLFILKQNGEFRGLYFPGPGRVVEQNERFAGLFAAIEVPLKGTGKQQLIYEGRIDDNIKITYLEFAEDFTKPVYFEGMTFNISSLNLVSVRDIMIEIIEANEEQVKFIVKN
ncbi:MAG TPA: hypothetical protein VIU41_06080 [Geobacteraceae bacterium]